jgi:hypothetical protein
VHIVHVLAKDGVRQHHRVELGANLLRHPKRFEEEGGQGVVLLFQKAVELEGVETLGESAELLGHGACHCGGLMTPKYPRNPPQLLRESQKDGGGVPL